MKWKCVLMMLGLGAAAIHAEESSLDNAPVPELPALNLPAGHNNNKLPELDPLLNNPNQDLPPPDISRPRPAVSGSGNSKDKNWLVNGMLDVQKKQREELAARKLKDQEAGNRMLQEEFERQQKAWQAPASPLDQTKFTGLTLSGSGSGTAAATAASGTQGLPNGRLTLSGSNAQKNISLTLTDLPALPEQYQFLNSGTQPASDFNPVLPRDNPAPGLSNSVLPQWSGNQSVAPRNPPALNLGGASLGAIPNLTPRLPAPTFDRQPALTAPVSAYQPPSIPGVNTNAAQFNSAQAASFLQQQDKSKAAVNSNRPAVKNISNGIPNPSEMRRF